MKKKYCQPCVLCLGLLLLCAVLLTSCVPQALMVTGTPETTTTTTAASPSDTVEVSDAVYPCACDYDEIKVIEEGMSALLGRCLLQPTLTEEQKAELRTRLSLTPTSELPISDPDGGVKIVAAWLTQNEFARQETSEGAIFPDALYEYTPTGFSMSCSRYMLLVDERDVFPDAEGNDVYLLASLAYGMSCYDVIEIRAASITDGGALRLAVDVDTHDGNAIMQSDLLVVKLDRASLGEKLPGHLLLDLLEPYYYQSWDVGDESIWENYGRTEEELAFARGLVNSKDCPAYVQLAIRIAYNTPAKKQDLHTVGVEFLVTDARNQLYAVVLDTTQPTGRPSEYTVGEFVFRYEGDRVIHVFARGELMPLDQAYDLGYVDDHFVERVYESDGPHVK